MTNNPKQFKKLAHALKLSSAEKAAMRGDLSRYMMAHPVVGQAARSPFSMRALRSRKSISAIVITSVLVGGATSFAAENTVPGDILYPVKTNVNEVVRGALAVTPQAKAAWDVELVNRRLGEMEKIAQNDTIATSTQATLEANLDKTTARVNDRIKSFENDHDEDLALQTAGDLVNVYKNHEHAFGLSIARTVASSMPAEIHAFSTTTHSSPSVGAPVKNFNTHPRDTNHAIPEAQTAILNKFQSGRVHAEEEHQKIQAAVDALATASSTSSVLPAQNPSFPSWNRGEEVRPTPTTPGEDQDHSSFSHGDNRRD